LNKSLTPLQHRESHERGHVDDCRKHLRQLRQLAGPKATGSAEKVELGLEKSILSGAVLKMLPLNCDQGRNSTSLSELRQMSELRHKCQSSSDRISANPRISASSGTEPADPGPSQAELIRFSNRMVDRRPDLADTRFASAIVVDFLRSRFRLAECMTSVVQDPAAIDFGIFIATNPAPVPTVLAR
jgi:hypothetical protein